MAVARHIVRALQKANAPGVAVGFAFINQHRCGAVELFGQLGIALAAKYRAGERIGIDQAEFVGREAEAAALVGQLSDLGGKANKFGLRSGG